MMRMPAATNPHDGLSCSGTLEGTVRTVVELSERDMRRRKLLLGSVFNAAAFAEPVLFALTAPPAESTARDAGRRVGMADVEILTEQIVHLGQLDHRHGSGRVREQVVHLLHRGANTILHGTYSEKAGRALLTAVAKATRLAGFAAADSGRHSLAQRYYIQGLDLGMRAGDRAYAAAELGRCLRDIGEAEQAITMSAVALRDYEHWRVRNRCWIQADLVTAHLLGGDLEQAVRSVMTRCTPPPRSARSASWTGCAPCNGRCTHSGPTPRTCARWTSGSLPFAPAPPVDTSRTTTSDPPSRIGSLYACKEGVVVGVSAGFLPRVAARDRRRRHVGPREVVPCRE
jgi:hypothetical protein